MLCDTQLWGQKGWGAGRLRRSHLVVLFKHLRDTKVDNLENVVPGEKEVVGLDITMYDTLGMY